MSNTFGSSSGGGGAGATWYTMAPAGAVGGEYIVYIVFGVISIFYAWFYKMHVVDQITPMKRQEETGNDNFDVGLCDCLGDSCMCLHMLLPCMVWVRQGHTNQVTNVCGFWATFICYLVSGLCCGIGPCCLTVYFRMRLKEHMGIDDHLLSDLCFAWLCMPCTVGQQALAVDQKLGYHVDGCCTLDWDDEQPQRMRGLRNDDYEASEDDYYN